MKKKIICTFVLMLLITTVFPMTGTVIAGDEEDSEIEDESGAALGYTELKISFFGSIRLLFMPAVGHGIDNIGDETAYNVTATFTVDGGFNGKIHLADTTDYTEILPGYFMITSWPQAIDGFGPLTITVNVDASNAEAVEKTARGFQIGLRTIIFG